MAHHFKLLFAKYTKASSFNSFIYMPLRNS